MKDSLKDNSAEEEKREEIKENTKIPDWLSDSMGENNENPFEKKEEDEDFIEWIENLKTLIPSWEEILFERKKMIKNTEKKSL